jgi:hypothetical protein
MTLLIQYNQKSEFTAGAKLPAVLKIGKNDQGVITIDSDSSWDSENILSKYVSGPSSHPQ